MGTDMPGVEQPLAHDIQPKELAAISDDRLLTMAEHDRLLGDGIRASLLSEYVRLRRIEGEFAKFRKDLSDRLTEEYVFAAETFAKSKRDKAYGGIRDAVDTVARLMGLEEWEAGRTNKEGK